MISPQSLRSLSSFFTNLPPLHVFLFDFQHTYTQQHTNTHIYAQLTHKHPVFFVSFFTGRKNVHRPLHYRSIPRALSNCPFSCSLRYFTRLSIRFRISPGNRFQDWPIRQAQVCGIPWSVAEHARNVPSPRWDARPSAWSIQIRAPVSRGMRCPFYEWCKQINHREIPSSFRPWLSLLDFGVWPNRDNSPVVFNQQVVGTNGSVVRQGQSWDSII